MLQEKNNPYLLSFTYEVLNIVVGHEDIFLGYH